MRIVIQRVKQAAVDIGGQRHSQIGEGLLVLLGIEDRDTDDDIDYLCRKVVAMRVFDDERGVMNLDVKTFADGAPMASPAMSRDILVVSQFTLMASTRKGNRPSYIHASKPDFAIPMYERFCRHLSALLGKPVQTGVFGADMQVSLVNDGPVTIIMDSHLRETF